MRRLIAQKIQFFVDIVFLIAQFVVLFFDLSEFGGLFRIFLFDLFGPGLQPILSFFQICFALVKPVSTIAKPACIRKTSAAPIKNQTPKTSAVTFSPTIFVIS